MVFGANKNCFRNRVPEPARSGDIILYISVGLCVAIRFSIFQIWSNLFPFLSISFHLGLSVPGPSRPRSASLCFYFGMLVGLPGRSRHPISETVLVGIKTLHLTISFVVKVVSFQFWVVAGRPGKPTNMPKYKSKKAERGRDGPGLHTSRT